MIGILCEKPSAANNFAKALGGMTGTYNGEKYVIACALGHLYMEVEPHLQVDPRLSNRYRFWSLDNLPWNEKDFKWEKTVKQTKDAKSKDFNLRIKSQLDVIKKAFTPCDELVFAGDVDPMGEGALISLEIFEGLGLLKGRKLSRMYFVDETPKSVQPAFISRKPIVDPYKHDEVRKALFRSRYDYLSQQFTRIATLCSGLPTGNTVRQGRLKSAMVVLVGQQLDAVNAYKKVPFYQNRFRDENGNVYTNPDEPTFAQEGLVPQIYAASDVVVDGKRMMATPPPALFDLATLAARLAPLGVGSKEVNKVVQAMYEKDIVTYPRTEDKTITPEQFNMLLPHVDKIAAVVGVDTSKLTHRQPRSTHVKAQGAHGANRPGCNVPKSLDEVERVYGFAGRKVYELLAMRYLTMLAEDYEYEQQQGHVKDYPAFRSVTQIPKKLGWRDVMDGDDGDIDAGKALGQRAEPFVHEGFPPKPQYPTMKWLMTQLRKRDVGTGATRTTIYSDVVDPKGADLMKDTKGRLTFTEKGDVSYGLLVGTMIGDLSATERMMEDLRDVAAGKADINECLHKMQAMVIHDIKRMRENAKERGVNTTMESEKLEGIFNGKTIRIKPSWGKHEITEDEFERLCNGEVLNFPEYGKDEFFLSEDCEYNGRKYTGIDRRKVDGGISDSEYVEGEWNGKKVRIKRTWGSTSPHTFTDDEIRRLFAGEEIEFPATSAKGNAYIARGRLQQGEFKGHKFVGFMLTPREK